MCYNSTIVPLPGLPRTYDELLRRAEATIGYRSHGFVEDALVYARWILEVADAERRESQRVIASQIEEIDELKRLLREKAAEKEP